jgi:hypothetical protein
VPTERLSMRKTREILRLKWHQGRSHRQIVAALAIGLGTPSEIVGRAKRPGITSIPTGTATRGSSSTIARGRTSSASGNAAGNACQPRAAPITTRAFSS